MQPDIFLFTDGSGHEDGFGGWAAIAVTADQRHKMFRMGAMSGTSTDRMEFTAMLEGLQMCVELSELLESKSDRLEGRKIPNVRLISDRENLVLSIMGVYERSNSRDLWSRFAWYEEHLNIHAVHVDDEQKKTMLDFCEVDLEASTARVILKSYVDAIPAFAPPTIKKLKKANATNERTDTRTESSLPETGRGC